MPETIGLGRILVFVWLFCAPSGLPEPELRSCWPLPDPLAGPKSRSTSGFHNLHHSRIGVQIWEFYLLLDLPKGLRINCHVYSQAVSGVQVATQYVRGLS